MGFDRHHRVEDLYETLLLREPAECSEENRVWGNAVAFTNALIGGLALDNRPCLPLTQTNRSNARVGKRVGDGTRGAGAVDGNDASGLDEEA